MSIISLQEIRIVLLNNSSERSRGDMLPSRPDRPPISKAFNVVMNRLGASNWPVVRLDWKAMHRAAIKMTGLEDFGDPGYRDGLEQVLESAARDAKLHVIGQLTLRRVITTLLCNRLLLAETMKKRSELFPRPLVPPIIVLGFPRSGTTFLHRMLALDPAHHGIPFWELMRPIPNGKRDRRRRDAEWESRMRRRLAPELDRIHYTRVDTPEECMFLLGTSFVSLLFWVAAPVHGYVQWYLAQDRRRAYGEYHSLLQIIQSRNECRGKRFVLKSPVHSLSLDALIQTLPDAMLVQTHRDPVPVFLSVSSLFYAFHSVVTRAHDLPRLVDTALSIFEYAMESNLNARNRYPESVFDVRYDHLVADPAGVVKEIYDHYDLPWTAEYETRLNEYIRDNPRGKYGRHRYCAADFGLREDALRERFSPYTGKFVFA
jgi:hypothetical protein